MSAERDVEIALCVFREANDALIVFDPRDRRAVLSHELRTPLTPVLAVVSALMGRLVRRFTPL
jgi:signal transduction histidine kinase